MWNQTTFSISATSETVNTKHVPTQFYASNLEVRTQENKDLFMFVEFQDCEVKRNAL